MRARPSSSRTRSGADLIAALAVVIAFGFILYIVAGGQS